MSTSSVSPKFYVGFLPCLCTRLQMLYSMSSMTGDSIYNVAQRICLGKAAGGYPLTPLSSMALDRIVSDTITCHAALSACAQGVMLWEPLTLLSNTALDKIVAHIISCNGQHHYRHHHM